MIVTGVDVTSFGALRDLHIDLSPNLTLIVGENEAGKSTLLAALRHALITTTDLTASRLAKQLGRYLPRPDGNVLDLRVTFDDGASAHRVWGAGARTRFTAADGTMIDGADAFVRLMERLPVEPGTFAALLCVDQAQLAATIETIGASDEARDEIAASLRSARNEAGGVGAEAFARVLQARVAHAFGRWDRERDRPEGGRGIERPWEKGNGEVIDAYYALERLRAELDATLRIESEIEAASARLARSRLEHDDARAFVEQNREAYEAIARVARIERELSAERTTLAALREAMKRWPVLEDEHVRIAAELTEATEAKAAADARVAALGEREELRRTVDRLGRAKRAAAELAAAQSRADELPRLDDEIVRAFRDAERDVEVARAQLSSGSITARVRAKTPGRIVASSDLDSPRTIELAVEAEERIEAHRRISIEGSAFVVEIEGGAESFDAVRERLAAAQAECDRIAAAFGVRDSDEAAARRTERVATEREIAQARRRFDEALDGATLAELEALVPADSDAVDAQDDVKVVAERAAAAGTRVETANAARRALDAEETSLASKYGDQDSLVDLLADARHRVTELEREIGSSTVPEPYTSAQEFLQAYEQWRDSLDAVSRAYHDARVAHAVVLATQPERSAEEVRSAISDAEAQYDRVRRRASALLRLEEAVTATIADQEEDPFTSAVEAVRRYLSIASDDAYAAAGDDPLLPSRFMRDDGPELEVPLLSQGARDLTGLAIRLALAEVALGDSSAPLLLDDPLVDLDPGRRASAARAITAYAASRQVILATCHPEHAELFPAAARVEIRRARGSTR